MRTTLTLEDDVAQTVREEMRSGSGKSLKQAVNELIRRGRYANGNNQRITQEFELKGRLLKSTRSFNFDSISKLLEEVEGPDFK